MSKEHIQPLADPDPSLREQIVAQFQQLPDEAQATVLIALSQTAEAEPDQLTKVFSVTGVSRADLQERLHYSDEALADLDDPAMREIAGKLEDAYVELGFWEHLEIVASEVLAQKRRLSAKK